jgi:hypothetical protein
VCPIADAQVSGNVHPRGCQLPYFFEKGNRIDDEAISDHGDFSRMEDAARNQTQDELAVADQDRMASVVPALIANDVVKPVCEQVDELALAFVSPLGSENDDIAHFFVYQH